MLTRRQSLSPAVILEPEEGKQQSKVADTNGMDFGVAGIISQPSLTLGLFLDDYSSFHVTRTPLLRSPFQQPKAKRQHGQPEFEEEGFELALTSLTWNIRAMLFTATYAASAIGVIWLLIFSNHTVLRLLAAWGIIELAWGNFMAYRCET